MAELDCAWIAKAGELGNKLRMFTPTEGVYVSEACWAGLRPEPCVALRTASVTHGTK